MSQPARPHGTLALASLAVLLALGLPWTVSSLTYIPGWYQAGTCVNEWSSGTVYCTPGFLAPGMTAGVSASAGAETVARVFLVAALLLILFAAGRRTWVVAAAGSVALGLLLTGINSQAGQIAAVVAVLLLLHAARALPGRGADLVGDVGARLEAMGSTLSRR